MTVYAVIPAVDGNRRIKNKLSQKVGKWTLLEKALICAQGSERVDSVFISTNNHDYAETAERFLAKAILRPAKYCSSDYPSEIACIHAIEWGGWSHDDVVVMLQGTSPFRTGRHVDEAFELFAEKQETVISMVKGPRQKQLYVERIEGWGRNWYEKDTIGTTNGAIYISTVKNLWERKTFHQPVVVPYFMDKRSSLDIDDEFDLEIARLLVDKDE